MTGKNKKNTKWEEAKKRCRLNAETVQMAKELGLNPKSIIKNIPNKSQSWKKPVYLWIREMYEERYGDSKKTSEKTDKKNNERSIIK